AVAQCSALESVVSEVCGTAAVGIQQFLSGGPLLRVGIINFWGLDYSRASRAPDSAKKMIIMEDTMTKNNEYFIRKAIDLALKSREQGNEPFGAVLVKDNEIVRSE